VEARKRVELTGTNRSCGLTIFFFLIFDAWRFDAKVLYASERKTNLCSQTFAGKKLSGGNGGGATPDPIPNSAVKPSSADGTARETVWESRTPPGIIFTSPIEQSVGLFLVSILVPYFEAPHPDVRT
jgi:hypothetical protein